MRFEHPNPGSLIDLNESRFEYSARLKSLQKLLETISTNIMAYKFHPEGGAM